MRTLLRSIPVLLFILTSAFLLSCAAPAELVRRSDTSLSEGDPHKALDWARRALKKEPNNRDARRAMTAAAETLAVEWKWRIRNLADVDTMAAANFALEYTDFRSSLARYRVFLRPDPAFDQVEAAVRGGAARNLYEDAEIALAAGHPRRAYRSFLKINHYVASYADAAGRTREAYEQAVVRVVILPFVDETGVRGLAETINNRIHREVVRRTGPKYFEFTEVIDPLAVMRYMTVAQTRELPRDVAISLGREVGADLVVRGRFYGDRAHSDTERFHETLYHRVVEKDGSGAQVERYVEETFDAVLRERRVKVHWDLDVLDTHRRTQVAERSEVAEAYARTVWTDFAAAGDCGDYHFMPPAKKKSDPVAYKKIESRWSDAFGTWTLAKFLDHARKNRGRRAYRPAYRDEFIDTSHGRRIFLNDLPDEDDLILIALNDVWRPVHATLKELDQE